MLSSSTCVICNGSSNNTKPHPAVNGHPSRSHSCGIDRFLADQEQRCPPEFGKTQSPAEAEAAAKAKMMTKLLEFEQKFGSGNKPPAN
ncbi:hypothetical protein N5P37_010535 [Trichoderma harzianum]|nr:hypothetical protein N5P37_010535 [Trichoderma harzianum]